MELNIKFTLFGKKLQTNIDCNSLNMEIVKYNLLGKLEKNLVIDNIEEIGRGNYIDSDIERLREMFKMK